MRTRSGLNFTKSTEGNVEASVVRQFGYELVHSGYDG